MITIQLRKSLLGGELARHIVYYPTGSNCGCISFFKGRHITVFRGYAGDDNAIGRDIKIPAYT